MVPEKSKEKIVQYNFFNFLFVAKLSEEEIEDYLDKKEPYDKAGAYAIQGYFSRYIVGIEGDYYNVMRLPIGRLYREHLRNYI